ncbi:MAG: hypothetical protein JWQ20_3928 [Conexibacter sp.]|nr:hypothetical protein [Conexibacter sp.]
MSLKRALAVVVGGLAAGAGLAGTASAADVTLWACHGPAGQPLGMAGFSSASAFDGSFGVAGGGCDGTAAADGLTLSLPGHGGSIAQGSVATYGLSLPSGLEARSVTLPWTISGFSPGSAPATSLRVRITSGASTLAEVRSDGPAGPTPAGPSAAAIQDGSVAVSLDCTAATACATPPGETPTASFGSVAFGAADAAAPHGSASLATEPVRDRMLRVLINAVDDGVGLGSAVVFIDGQVAGQADLRGGCTDLQPGGGLDLPVGALCQRSVASVPVTIDLTGRSSGEHTVQVIGVDAVGNAAPLMGKSFTINDAQTGPQQTSATLTVGTGTPEATPAAVTNGQLSGSSLVRRVVCDQAKLSVLLVTKPVAVRGTTVVLHRKGRTFFRGHLTCMVRGRRVAGPRSAGIEVRSTFGKDRVLQRTGPSLRGNGRFAWTLTRTTTRTLSFRVQPVGGPPVSVTFRLKAMTAKQIAELRKRAGDASTRTRSSA